MFCSALNTLISDHYILRCKLIDALVEVNVTRQINHRHVTQLIINRLTVTKN